MGHDIHLAGHAFALRPIRLSDAALVVELRADADRTRHLNSITQTVTAQEAYLAAYLTRENDYYFVIEDRATGRAEGLIGLYGVDPQAGRGEAGRWILRHGSLAAVESALLIYRVAFERLQLDEVLCLTTTDNTRVVSFHDSCGLERRNVRPRDVQIGERWCDRQEHVLTRQHWPTVAAKLDRLAQCVT
ncbi:MAG: GNAT family N-acetyltransferase [Gemmataceae bacterium]